MHKLQYIILFLSVTCFGQIQQLDEVVLQAQRIQSSINPVSITPIAPDSLRLKQEIGELLQSVPGLFVSSQQNFSQDTRISIRGFGTRATFGIRGIKVLLDGVPVSTPDGQTQLDHISLSTLGKVEVIRGLASGLYGNASGGVILLKSAAIKNEQLLAASVGAFGTRHFLGSYGKRKEKQKFRAVVEHKKYTGYRKWSAYENTLINLSNTFTFSSKRRLSLDYAYFNSPKALDAGGLTLSEVNQDRRQARQRNLDYKAGEKVGQHQFTARWQTKKWTAYGFYTQRNLDARLPFENSGQIDLNRNYYGLGVQHDGRQGKWLWQYGVEAAAQRDRRIRFNNNLGEKGSVTLNQREGFYSLGAYGIAELLVSDWRVRASLRADTHQIKLNDFINTNSATRNLAAFSPSIAAFYSISTNINTYIRWSTGFETPSLNELSANPSGAAGFNQLLEPQRSQETELGFQFTLDSVDGTLTLFTTKTQDEILPYELDAFPGQNFYRNIGEVNRKGIEITTVIKMTKAISANLAYTYGTFTARDDKELPNVPNQQFSMGLIHLFGATRLAVDVRHIGKRFANSNNTVEIPKFWTLDMYAQRRFGQVTGSAGITNLTKAYFYDNIRINAFGGRYYEPAATRQLFIRLRLQL